MRAGQSFRNFVPNNDLDLVGGDPKRVGEIRAPKLIRPILFEAQKPLLYFWRFDDNPGAKANAKRVCVIAEWVYQLGRGVDMAWAWGEVIGVEEAEARLAIHGGVVHRPYEAGGGTNLAVPIPGSLASIIARHKETRARFQTFYESRPNRNGPEQTIAVGQIFSQPRKPRFGQVAYDSPAKQSVFDLIGPNTPWRLDRIGELTERVRDGAAVRLKEAWPAEGACVERVLIGRNATEADKDARVRITPLPSIGHHLADHAIRRVLIEIRANCPLPADDLEWAFSGLPVCVSEQGEVLCGSYRPRTIACWRITASMWPRRRAGGERSRPRRFHNLLRDGGLTLPGCAILPNGREQPSARRRRTAPPEQSCRRCVMQITSMAYDRKRVKFGLTINLAAHLVQLV